MRLKMFVLAWIAISLAGASRVMGIPQETAAQRNMAEMPDKEATQSSLTGGDREPDHSAPNRVMSLADRFLLDQKRIWASPAQLRLSDAGWLLPLGGLAATFFATDAEFNHHLSHTPSTTSHYNTLSNASVAALVGAAGGLWLMSFPKHNQHWQETGFLSGEAALNAVLDAEMLKATFRRLRPDQGNGDGAFFQPGGKSFPSEHAAVAFAVAGVIAHEYPGPVPKILAYGLATAVAISRVKAQQHFNSDVLVGSVMGDMIAQSVYSHHFDPELGGATWISTSQYFREHWKPSPKSFGSPFVPLDSWIYPALERLGAMGFLATEFEGIKPWTRLECTNLYLEAETKVRERAPEFREANEILLDLGTEFAPELRSIEEVSNDRLQMESLYSRSTWISGTPLNDSYHFGQTLINNDGRPYEEGYNDSTGFSTYGLSGRFALYVSGEFQHAPYAPAYTLEQRELISKLDLNPVQPTQAVEEVNRFALLDTYVATNIEGWDFSFGRQSIWWGPCAGSAFLYSNNAAPPYMFQVSRVAPFEFPWLMRYLGPAKIDFFFGRVQGNEFPGRPLIHGTKISFKPTPNLELGFGVTSEFGGIGRAMTPGAIINSFIAYSSSVNYAANENPGKRTGSVDFTYRLPFVRNWLSVYADSLSPDDPSPLAAPRRAAWNPGLYLSHFPYMSWLDLRVEAVVTETAARDPTFSPAAMGGRYVYWDLFYHDLYTNQGNIVGSWIGREGKGYQAWSTVHFGPKNFLQFGYRHAEVASDFIPRGEAINDGSISVNRWIGKEMSVAGFLQYERWNIPVLAAAPQTDWTSSVQLTFWPKTWK